MSVALVVGHALVGLGTGTIAASTILATARGWREDTWLRRVGRVALALTGPPTRPVRRVARRLRESRAETCDRLGHDRTAWDGVWTRCRRCQANGEPVQAVQVAACDCYMCAEPKPLTLRRGNVDDAVIREFVRVWEDASRQRSHRASPKDALLEATRVELDARLRELERPWTRYYPYVEYDVTTVSDRRRMRIYLEK